MSRIYFNISDIAALIGRNQYDYVSAFNRLVRKYDKEYISGTLLNTFERIKQNCPETIASIDHFEQEIKLAEKSKKNIIESITNDNSVPQNQKKTLIENKINIINTTLQEKRDIILKDQPFLNDIRETVNTHTGTLLEDTAIQKFEKKFKTKLDTTQTYYSAILPMNYKSNYEFYIGGKVDGLNKQNNQNSYIVEVKNRMKGFFNGVREYENVQMQMYMYILNVPETKLVEQYRDRIRVTSVLKNQQFIDKVFLDLQIFAQAFEYDFLNNKSNRVDYYSLSDNKTKCTAFVHRLYINKINEMQGEPELEPECDSDLD